MFASLVSFAFFFYQLSPTNGVSWEVGDYPLPQRIFLAPAFSINDNIAYIFDVRGDIPTIYKLDTTISNPSWQPLSVTMPFADTNLLRDQAVKVGKLFYFYQFGESMGERKFYIFDTTTDTFLDNTNIASAQYNSGQSLNLLTDYNNFIYVVGGQSASYGQYIQRYDITTNVWNVLSTNCPVGDKWFWLQAVYYPPQNRIYVFGGYSPLTQAFTDMYYFDLNTNLWSNSIGQWSSSATWFGTAVYISDIDRIYIIAMSGTEVKIYDATTNTFTTTTNTPSSACQSAAWASAIILNNRLQRFGGTSSSGVNCRTDELYSSSIPVRDTVDLVRFTQNHQYMEDDSNQGLVMKSNSDTLNFFLDSTFNKVNALNGASDCYSFQSIHYPDQYIGHNLVRNDGSVVLYVADAANVDSVTWCDIPALNEKGGVTWVPFAYSRYYMRKKPQSNTIAVAQNDGTVAFKDDASFHMWQFDPIAF